MIAVTGAAGFIGSNLARRLSDAGHELVLVDHPLTPEKTANLAGLEYPFAEHDRFIADLEAGTVSPDSIFHLGACSATTEQRWDYLAENNVAYTRRLWSWCAANDRRFVYASSAATYGDGARGFDDRTPPELLTPLNLYGKSKNDFDIWALDQVMQGGPVPPGWAGMKFFNVYGPGEGHKGGMASVVWQAFNQIKTTGRVKLFRSTHPDYADGGQLRDFVFVGDVIDHMLWLHERPEKSGIYNSGSGAARSFLDLANATFAAMGREPMIEFIDMPASLAGQYQNYTLAEMEKLRTAGYDGPATSLEAGAKLAVEGY